LFQFPYLPDGPIAITPFIFAVECLLASERIPAFTHLTTKLTDEVLRILLDNPADSWKKPGEKDDDIINGPVRLDELEPFPSENGNEGMVTRTQPIQQDQYLYDAFNRDTEGELDLEKKPYDAECGLGPEEIVAACLLAGYISERQKVLHIAKCAFMWARGWLDVSDCVLFLCRG
jgi:hypothetical protein